jgi:hypothetical protein
MKNLGTNRATNLSVFLNYKSYLLTYRKNRKGHKQINKLYDRDDRVKPFC